MDITPSSRRWNYLSTTIRENKLHCQRSVKEKSHGEVSDSDFPLPRRDFLGKTPSASSIAPSLNLPSKITFLQFRKRLQ